MLNRDFVHYVIVMLAKVVFPRFNVLFNRWTSSFSRHLVNEWHSEVTVCTERETDLGAERDVTLRPCSIWGAYDSLLGEKCGVLSRYIYMASLRSGQSTHAQSILVFWIRGMPIKTFRPTLSAGWSDIVLDLQRSRNFSLLLLIVPDLFEVTVNNDRHKLVRTVDTRRCILHKATTRSECWNWLGKTRRICFYVRLYRRFACMHRRSFVLFTSRYVWKILGVYSLERVSHCFFHDMCHVIVRVITTYNWCKGFRCTRQLLSTCLLSCVIPRQI